MALDTTSLLGLSTNYDFNFAEMLAATKTQMEVPITELGTKKTTITTKQSELNTIESLVISARSYTRTLSSSSTYLEKSVSVSNSVLSASATSTAEAGYYSVEVTQLAQKSSWLTSSGYASKDTAITTSEKALTYTIGGVSKSITIAAGSTLESLVSTINANEDSKVTASIINTGDSSSPYKLSIVAKTAGEENRISDLKLGTETIFADQIASDNNILNAKVKYNGVEYQRQTNSSIDDIILGVTLNLSEKGTSAITISQNTSSIKENITNMINSLNTLITTVKEKTAAKTDSGEPAALAFSSVNNIPYLINSILQSNISTSDGTVTNLSDLGITMSDGLYTIDSSTLTEALSSSFTKVSNIFSGYTDSSSNSVDGIGTKIHDLLMNFTDTGGIVNSEKAKYSTNLEFINEEIEKKTETINNKYEILKNEYIQADIAIAKLSSQEDYIKQMIESENND